jgi:hypothetical protein
VPGSDFARQSRRVSQEILRSGLHSAVLMA